MRSLQSIRPHLFVRFIWLLLPFLFTPSEGAREGKAHLIIQHLTPSPNGTALQVGDIFHLALKVDAQNENITGVVVYLSVDDDYFEIIPARQSRSFFFPFRQGNWLNGTVFLNSTLGDSLLNGQINSMGNKRPNYQLVYNEDKPPTFSGTRNGVSGKGTLAEFTLRLIKDHPNPLQAITVDHTSPTGSESGYFVKDFPGTVYSLKVQYGSNRVGDFNDDNVCDFQDFLLFIQNYEKPTTNNTYSSRYDLDSDQKIGFNDFIIFSQVFGK
jgi:hypothetical protein